MFLSSVSSRSERFILGKPSVPSRIQSPYFRIAFSGLEGKYRYLCWVSELTDNDVLNMLFTFKWDGNEYWNQDKNPIAVTIKEVFVGFIPCILVLCAAISGQYFASIFCGKTNMDTENVSFRFLRWVVICLQNHM